MSEAPDASYDLIIVDAFASDSVPLHLLTREALSLYTRKLRGDGEVLFHVSNRYLDLAPAIGGAAQALGLKAYTASGETMDEAAAIFPSRWVRVPRLSAAALPPSNWLRVIPRPADQDWSDDRSNVLGLLRPVRLVRERISEALNY